MSTCCQVVFLRARVDRAPCLGQAVYDALADDSVRVTGDDLELLPMIELSATVVAVGSWIDVGVTEQNANAGWKTVRVFVSSTLRDMRTQRDD